MALLRKPRLFQSVEVAARAQALGWRRKARGYVRRAAFGVGAVVFGILVLLGLHIAIWAGLTRTLGPVGAALGVAALDLLFCFGLVWMATHRSDDAIVQGASTVRDDAVRSADIEVRTLGGLLRRHGDVPLPRSRRVRVYPARLGPASGPGRRL